MLLQMNNSKFRDNKGFIYMYIYIYIYKVFDNSVNNFHGQLERTKLR